MVDTIACDSDARDVRQDHMPVATTQSWLPVAPFLIFVFLLPVSLVPVALYSTSSYANEEESQSVLSVGTSHVDASEDAAGQVVWKSGEGEGAQALEFRADHVEADATTGRIFASGKVRIRQGKMQLVAGEVLFDQEANTWQASGGVYVASDDFPEQSMYLDHLDFDRELGEGLARVVRIVTKSQGGQTFRHNAAGGKVREDGSLHLANLALTACSICNDSGEYRDPLWSFTAEQAVVRPGPDIVEYRHLVLRFWDAPILYVPYFFSVQEGSRRRLGFLSPQIGSKSRSGFHVTIPFYVPIARSGEVRFFPTFTSQGDQIFAGRWRQQFSSGEVFVEASATIIPPSPEDLQTGVTASERYHVNSGFALDPSHNWRLRSGLQFASDRSYPVAYDFWDLPDRELTSHVTVERFGDDSWLSAEIRSFTDLRERGDPLAPLILPGITFEGRSDPDEWGGRFAYATGYRRVRQPGKFDVRRVRVASDYLWRREFVGGFLLTLEPRVLIDLYSKPDSILRTDYNLRDHLRHHAWVEAELSLPFIRQEITEDESKPVAFLLEPIIQASVAPEANNPDPSLILDPLRSTDDRVRLLYHSNPGDFIEGGATATMGVRWSRLEQGGGYLTFAMGQRFVDQGRQVFEDATVEETPTDDTSVLGLEPEAESSPKTGSVRNQRGVFAEVNWSPGGGLGATGSVRVNPQTGELLEQEWSVQQIFGPVSYSGFFLEQRQRSEAGWGVSLALGQDTNLSGFQAFDLLAKRNGRIRSGLSLQYRDECFSYTIDYAHRTALSVEGTALGELRFTFRFLGF